MQKYFQDKIEALSNDKLLELAKVIHDTGSEVFLLTRQEIEKRNLSFDWERLSNVMQMEDGHFDQTMLLPKLKKWNWAAFLLAPLWALGNKLDKLAVLCFIPFVSIIVMFYLGLYGNRLAYIKSEIRSVDDFMTLQKLWTTWSIRFFLIYVSLILVDWFFNIG